MFPTIGRIVHYRLTANDAETILARRAATRGQSIGNTPHEGQVVPLIITAVWPEEYAGNARLGHHEEGTKYDGPEGVNGQVLLDGNDSLWVTSIPQHEELTGCWLSPYPRGIGALASGDPMSAQSAAEPTPAEPTPAD